MGKLLRFLVLACVVQVAGAQGLFKGFTPDENGTNLDAPKQQNVAPVTIIKDCPECPEMVVLPGGSFLMGSPPDQEPDPFSNEKPKAIGSADEKPQHRVQIQSFAIGKYEVTQEQWFAVMGNNPSGNKGRTLPVEQVSWDDIQQFIAKLNQKTGQKYRLPSEAEWEYAARAGTTTEWSFGNDESKLGNYAWNARNSGGKTQVVGQKLPNAFGLFDMHGNVWEWTQDCWHNNYVGAPTDGNAWTTGCAENGRVLRGGSWGGIPADLRSANRYGSNPGFRNVSIGFRLAKDVQSQNALEALTPEKLRKEIEIAKAAEELRRWGIEIVKAEEADRLRDEQAQSEKLRKDALERAIKQAGTAVSNDGLKKTVSDALLPLTEK